MAHPFLRCRIPHLICIAFFAGILSCSSPSDGTVVRSEQEEQQATDEGPVSLKVSPGDPFEGMPSFNCELKNISDVPLIIETQDLYHPFIPSVDGKDLETIKAWPKYMYMPRFVLIEPGASFRGMIRHREPYLLDFKKGVTYKIKARYECRTPLQEQQGVTRQKDGSRITPEELKQLKAKQWLGEAKSPTLTVTF